MPRKVRRREKALHKVIAKQRISQLFELAEREALRDRMNRADRYVEIARKIGMKYRVRIPKKYKLLFCKNCYRFLLPGVNARIRVSRGRLIIYCSRCGSYRRISLKEKSSATLK